MFAACAYLCLKFVMRVGTFMLGVFPHDQTVILHLRVINNKEPNQTLMIILPLCWQNR